MQRNRYDCESQVALQEVIFRKTMKNNDGNEKDQNIRKAHSK